MEREGGREQLCGVYVRGLARQAPPESPMPSAVVSRHCEADLDALE